MTLTSPSAPGNPGGPATPTPTDDYENLPPYPHGWTAEAWAALCDSAASRSANRIYAQSVTLLDKIKDFLTDHGPDLDADVVREAKRPLPMDDDLAYLSNVRHHFAGIVWPLEQMVDAVKDVLPDDVTEPATVAVPVAQAEPASTEDAGELATFEVYYLHELDLHGRRPRLQILSRKACGTNDGNYFSDFQEHEHLGELDVPTDATAPEIEAAAMAKYGGQAGDQGLPAFAEFCEVDHWGNLVGKVAVALLTWPRSAPFGWAGEPTPEAVAAGLGRNVIEVRAAMKKLAPDRRAAA